MEGIGVGGGGECGGLEGWICERGAFVHKVISCIRIGDYLGPRSKNSTRLKEYDWRAQESLTNALLYLSTATVILLPVPHPSLHIHFVHKRSPHPSCVTPSVSHSWSGSILSVGRLSESYFLDSISGVFDAGA